MADTGLLGLDPSNLGSTIQGLLSQMGPSQDLVNAANKRAQLDFFLGLLGTPKGLEFRGLGQSGLNALNARDNYIATQQGLEQQNMQLVMPLLQLGMRQQMMKDWNNAISMGQSPDLPTQNGAPAPFQQPGGAASLMGQALGSSAPAPTQLPTQVPVPGAISPQEAKYNLLSALNLRDMSAGFPDKSAAIKTMFPAPTALRPNAPAINNFGRVITQPVPVPPSGSRVNIGPDGQQSFSQVPGAPQALAQPTVAKNLADLATGQQIGVIPGGGEGVVGTKLGALGGAAGQYSFLNNLFSNQAVAPPGSASAPPASLAPSPAPSAPVQTKLSPEQEKNSAALGEDLAGYREQVSKSSNAMAQLNEISSALQYFTPGPLLPARAAIAGQLQQIPGIGRTLANQFVPNSASALPAIAAMEKIGVGLTAEQSKVFGSREGQMVIGMIKSAMPNAEMVPGAPQIIVDAMKGMHQWSIDKGIAAQAWIKNPASHGSLDGFSTAWDSAHPVSSYVGNLPALAAIAKGASPASIDQPQVAPQAQPQAAPSGWSIRRIN